MEIDCRRAAEVSELRDDTAKWLAVAEEGPIFILQSGSPRAVLIGMRAFRELLERAALRADLSCRERESARKLSLEDL